jgi:TatD DNase family protein
MWFDSHCHLDATEFSQDLSLVIARAAEQGVSGILIPTVDIHSIDHVIEIVEKWSSMIPYLCFTLGIHPLYTPSALEADIGVLRQYLEKYQHHPQFVGVGEIGLDYFVTNLDSDKQEWFFDEQLKLAKEFDLPVILHVRKSQDQILKRLRKIGLSGGIAHAFNGSHVQANEFLKLNFKLGFGGTLTYERALQIRRLAMDLPIESYVLETDAPDIPPSWLKDSAENLLRNEPLEIPAIAQVFATLRELSLPVVATMNLTNIRAVLPRLDRLMQV